MAARMATETVLVDDRLDPDRLILEGIDVSEGPHFSVGNVSTFFFARSPHWIRWLERKGQLVLDGKPVGDSRSERGARYYTLADVELIAHALAENRAINAAQLRLALMMVRLQAEMYGFI